MAKPDESGELRIARETLSRFEDDARNVIKVLTVEQALKAQRIVREAGRRKGNGR